MQLMTTPIPSNTILLRFGGLASIGMALCYVAMAVIFLGMLSMPAGLDTAGKIQYLQQHHLLVASGYGIGYLLFGMLLAIVLKALQRVFANTSSAVSALSERFGNVWLALMMASGMMALIGLQMVFRLMESDPQQALALYNTRNLLTESLGGGIELVGGLWVLLLSISGLQQQCLGKALHMLGLVVGALGILTVMHTLPYLKDAFGITQLIWFIWLGVSLLRCSAGKGISTGVS